MNYTVFRYSDLRRPYFVVRWSNGPTGFESGEKSTKLKNRRKAEQWAGEFIASLQSRDGKHGNMTWAAFKDIYQEKRLVNIKSSASYRTAIKRAEEYLSIKYLRDLDAAAILGLQQCLQSNGYSKATQASYAKHLRAILRWAESEGYIDHVPRIKTGSTDAMRGRPLTTEEYERLLNAVVKLVGIKNALGIQRTIQAAWSIGLRRSEVFDVYWDREDYIHPLGLNAGTPRIFFPASRHKAGRDLLLPLLPEAAEMLRKTPKRDRQGAVFLPLKGIRKRIESPDGLGKLISLAGKKANIITHKDPTTGRVRYATMHDLRRSLGERLAHSETLSIPEVAHMMRHRKIDTTLAHYANMQCTTLGDKLTELGCTLGCTAESTPKQLFE